MLESSDSRNFIGGQDHKYHKHLQGFHGSCSFLPWKKNRFHVSGSHVMIVMIIFVPSFDEFVSRFLKIFLLCASWFRAFRAICLSCFNTRGWSSLPYIHVNPHKIKLRYDTYMICLAYPLKMMIWSWKKTEANLQLGNSHPRLWFLSAVHGAMNFFT